MCCKPVDLLIILVTTLFISNNIINKYKCWTKHAFVYDSHFKPLHQNKCCGVLIDNRADAPICVWEDKYRESKKKLAGALRELFGGKCHVEHVYRITPC